MSKELPIRIAFWLVQDSIQQWSNWIAGLHYVCHCLEALSTLPVEDRPSVVAFVPETLQEKLRETFDFSLCDWIELVLVSEADTATPEGLLRLAEAVDSRRCQILFPAISTPCVAFSGKLVAWITDYQHKYYPEFFSASECTFRDHLYSFLTAVSTRVICSSEIVRQDMERFYPAAKGRGCVLRFSTAPPQTALSSDLFPTLKRLGIDQPYAYLPYQFWKHKNHLTVFRAWKVLREQGNRYLLVCTGSTIDSRSPEHFSELNDFLENAGIAEDVRILGMVPREDQWQLYRGAKLILQPSLFEGWSTSVEEARCLGKPVLLSDIPVHREQLGSRGFFFEPMHSESLADLVAKVWNEFPTGLDLESEGSANLENRARLETFGRTLLEIFHETLMESTASVAADVLPLFLYFQGEARERLRIVQQMQQHIAYLQGQIDHLHAKMESMSGEQSSSQLVAVRPDEYSSPNAEASVSTSLQRQEQDLASPLWTRLSQFLTRIARRES